MENFTFYAVLVPMLAQIMLASISAKNILSITVADEKPDSLIADIIYFKLNVSLLK